MSEIWKDIKDYEGLYQVSNLGRVKSLDRVTISITNIKFRFKGQILKGDNDRKYLRYRLCKNNKTKVFSGHRLVAIMFIDNPNKKPCVNHIDGNPSNNKINNLEWCSYSENEKHSYDILGKVNPIRKLSEEAVKDIRDNCVKRKNTMDFATKYKVDRSTVLNVLNNRYYV